MINYLNLELLLILLRSYTGLDTNTFLSLYLHYCILLYIDLVLIINFPSLLSNVYVVFLIRFIFIIKNTSINKKEIWITLEFLYTKI